MEVEIALSGADARGRNYLTWTPIAATVRLLGGPHGPDPVPVTVGNGSVGGGQLQFADDRQAKRSDHLDLTLAPDGTPSTFWVAGKFGSPSTADGDASVQVTTAGQAAPLGTRPVMVRVRKNANTLSDAERKRFIDAFAQLNAASSTTFHDLREAHRSPESIAQAHGNAGFLAWHRAFLLDLERELQKQNAGVALPYWRFDRPAPNVFSSAFMGQTRTDGTTVVFDPDNGFKDWRFDNHSGFRRRANFDPLGGTPNGIRSEAQTMIVGNGAFDRGPGLSGFTRVEGNPHGSAHNGFGPPLSQMPNSPQDPLFFLLHCNVDRLWALWQHLDAVRLDGTQPETYFFGRTITSPTTLKGHNLHDTLWPWDGDVHPPRPPIAPRPPFAPVPTAPGPGPRPMVEDMIDYQGFLRAGADTNVAYDGIPFEPDQQN